MRMSSALVLAYVLLAAVCHAEAQDGSFGAPAMLPLPASLAPPNSAGYFQPNYPPGIGDQGGYRPGFDSRRQPNPVQPNPAQPRDNRAAYGNPNYHAAPQQPVRATSYADAPPQTNAAGAGPEQSPFEQYANQFSQPSGCDNGFAEALGSPCNSCATCGTCCRPTWFGALGGMILTRNSPNGAWTSALVNNNFSQVMNTRDADANWGGGGEVRVGRQLCCGGAWEVTYWSIAPLTGFASYTDPGNLLTPINLFGVDIDGTPADAYFDDADQHRIWRRDTFQNVELNWYSTPVRLTNRTCTLTWLAGLRYFQFNDGLIFGSVSGGNSFGSDGGIHEAYINSQVRNRLFGPQVGVIANYFVHPRFSVFAVPKFGVFNNWAHEDFQLYRGDGFNAFTIRENQNLLAFLSQIDVGGNWALTPRCSIYAGYRVVVATSVALADNQIPQYLIDHPEISKIKSNGDLVLHGAIFGMQFLF